MTPARSDFHRRDPIQSRIALVRWEDDGGAGKRSEAKDLRSLVEQELRCTPLHNDAIGSGRYALKRC